VMRVLSGAGRPVAEEAEAVVIGVTVVRRAEWRRTSDEAVAEVHRAMMLRFCHYQLRHGNFVMPVHKGE